MRQHKDIHKAGTTEYVAFLRSAPEIANQMPVVHTTEPVRSLKAAKKAVGDALINCSGAIVAEVEKTVWGDAHVIVDFDGEKILWIEDYTEKVHFGLCRNDTIHWSNAPYWEQ